MEEDFKKIDWKRQERPANKSRGDCNAKLELGEFGGKFMGTNKNSKNSAQLEHKTQNELVTAIKNPIKISACQRGPK